MVEIKSGAFYRTRDGHKVGPMVATSSPEWPWGDSPNWGISRHWKHDGMFGSRSLNDMDIVAEWTDFIPPCDDPELPGWLRIDMIDAPSPIRTKTVTEIVSGVYGRVKINAPIDFENGVGVRFVNRSDPKSDAAWPSLDADELSEAAILFWRLAEALRTMGTPS